MKRVHILSILVTALILSACSSSKETTGVWVNKEKIQGKTFNKIFIIVMTADVQARVRLEKNLAEALVARGKMAYKSIDVMPMSLDNPQTPSKEEIVSKVKASGADAVFITNLLKKEESIRYTPGKTSYTIMPYYSAFGTYYGYYGNWYPSVSKASYYTKDKSYFMLSNLFDVASEEIMWSVQSEVFDPSTLDKFNRNYINTLLNQLESAKLIKK